MKSRMSREVQVRFCEGPRVRSPWATRRNIYVGTKRSGERVLESITTYLEGKLKLKVNHGKSAVDRPHRRTFLGYSFTPEKKPRIRVPRKSVQKMKSKLKKLCREGRGRNLERFICETLNPVLRGWTNYFRLRSLVKIT